MAKIQYVFILLILCLIPIVNDAQQIPTSEAEARAELTRRGISEAEVRAALAAEGIEIDDLNNVSDLSPSEIARLQQIISDLESQKSNNVRVTPQAPPQEVSNVPSIQEDIVEKVVRDIKEDSIALVPVIDKSRAVTIYGQDIFRNGSIEVFQQTSEIKPPETYVLGVGDELSVSIFGRSQFEEKYEIRPDGYIRVLDGNKRILMKGSTLAAAKEKLFKTFSNYYNFNQGQFEVTLTYQRTVNVGIYGEVFKVGSYQLLAFNNVINALVAVKGPNDIGTLRKIQLLKASGGVKTIDIYEYMANPKVAVEYYLEDNDVIHVPVQGKVISIQGAVKKPLSFELLDNENLKQLLIFAGGLNNNAYQKTFELYRYIDDKRVKLDIPYNQLLNSNSDFTLLDGDQIIVEAITIAPRNFVNVSGSVVNEGEFQRKEGMRVNELIKLAGLKPESYTKKALLLRTNSDETKIFEWINVEEIMKNPQSNLNIALEDEDILTIWNKARFIDTKVISIDGSVRSPGDYPYDESRRLRLSDVVFLAGGLSRDAGDIAMISRRDPLVPNSMEYFPVNLDVIMDSPESDQNIFIEGFDIIEIYSENNFVKEQYVSVEGAVNKEGEFLYGKNMTVADALILAQGLQLGASTNNIEISRLEFRENNPTKTVIARLNIERDFLFKDGTDSNFKLQPFDNIYVRFVPEFEIQQEVFINGEVIYPGAYPLLNDNEKISNVLRRAGGLTKEAFPAGAKLIREEDQLGQIVMRLDEILDNENSKYNFILKNGDRIEIPKQQDFVKVKGATRVDEVLNAGVIGADNEIKVPFHEGKNALFYVNYYAGGIADRGRKKLIFVEHPNGEVKKTKRQFPIGFKFPVVRKGSTIKVGAEPIKPKEPGEENKEEVDWTKVLGDSVAQAMSILTLILLIQRLD